MAEYTSVFGCEMMDYLNYQRRIGRDVRGYITIFNQLDHFLSSEKIVEKRISKTLAEQFADSFSVRPICLYTYLSHYNLFAKYLNSIGYYAFELELPKYQSDYTPYIFSDEEMKRIFYAADNYSSKKCPLYSVQLPVLIRILYGCGTRVTETLCLKVRDMDLNAGVMNLRHTKNNRQRFVPMDSSLSSICDRFIKARNLKNDNYLFYMQNDQTRWTTYSADSCFAQILKAANIVFVREKPNDRGPCLHSLRHTFVINSLKQSEKAGRIFEDTVPFLSTYLGHAGIRETDKYLRFCYELYDEAVDKIETYTASLFPEVN